MSVSDGPIVGIDLGTTHSLVAHFRDGRPVLIPNALGKLLTPSVVGIVDGRQAVVGEAAHALRFRAPASCAWCFKRHMGTDHRVNLDGHELTAPELSSLVLASLKSDAERHLGTPVVRAVISVPAYFDEHQRLATKQAGEIAGLRVERIVNEPTAAALAYGLADPDTERRLLVVDLGGGTFDVTLMEVFEGSLEIVATSGESHLGGEDFTLALVQYAAKNFGLDAETLETVDPLRFAALRHEAERAKKRLSAGEDQARLGSPDERGFVKPGAPSCDIDRDGYLRLVAPLMRRLRRPVQRVLGDARISHLAIDQVLLVGGATRMPWVHDLLRDTLDCSPLADQDPDHVVALGTAVQAALLQNDAAVEDLLVTDVAPFTLGVEISKAMGMEHRTGYLLPIIHRNTTVPVAREKMVETVDDGQTHVNIKVYQGEARRVEENLLLGELDVRNIPPGPAGQSVRVRFAYDSNGLLDVGATVVSTRESFETVIVHPQSTLAPEAVDEALERLRRVTALPSDDAENLMLLHYAEKLVAEAPVAQREGLERVLDEYEAALAVNDREGFDQARRALQGMLDHLDLSSLEH